MGNNTFYKNCYLFEKSIYWNNFIHWNPPTTFILLIKYGHIFIKTPWKGPKNTVLFCFLMIKKPIMEAGYLSMHFFTTFFSKTNQPQVTLPGILWSCFNFNAWK